MYCVIIVMYFHRVISQRTIWIKLISYTFLLSAFHVHVFFPFFFKKKNVYRILVRGLIINNNNKKEMINFSNIAK
jgi:hypothetical protein